MGRDEAVPPSGVRDIVPHLRSRRALIPFVACWLVLTLLLGVASKSGNPEIRPDGAQAQHTVRPSGCMRPMQIGGWAYCRTSAMLSFASSKFPELKSNCTLPPFKVRLLPLKVMSN